MNNKIILLIGGPGSGKTSIIDGLAQKGYTCYPEISRQVTLDAQKKGVSQLFLKEPLFFSELLLNERIKQYQNALQDKAKHVFIDRGIPDVLAYMRYINSAYPQNFDDACKKYIYSKIFILPPWKEIYVTDNERYETFDQANLIHHFLIETYESYGYQLHQVPMVDLDARIDFVLNNI